MQAKSELSASNKSAQNSVDRLIKFIELVQSLWQPIIIFPVLNTENIYWNLFAKVCQLILFIRRDLLHNVLLAYEIFLSAQ